MEEKEKKKKSRKETKQIDEKVLTKAIVNALEEYDDKKKEREEQEYYEEQNKNGIGFKMFFKMLCCPKKYVNTQGANETVVKGFLKFIYKIFEWIFLIGSLFLLSCVPLQFILNVPIVPWWCDVLYCCGAVICLLISRVLRIMALDVERSKDKNFLIALLAVIIALISMVIAIVTLRSKQ
ncbi:MAG: hypothetical protein IJ538_02655 [Clostridia bacterium]|nr:hypothetical protein [Clostridia bacterium]